MLSAFHSFQSLPDPRPAFHALFPRCGFEDVLPTGHALLGEWSPASVSTESASLCGSAHSHQRLVCSIPDQMACFHTVPLWQRESSANTTNQAKTQGNMQKIHTMTVTKKARPFFVWSSKRNYGTKGRPPGACSSHGGGPPSQSSWPLN